MKIKFIILIIATASTLLSSCEYDNFTPPESTLSGKVVYVGNAVNVRNNGPVLELWQDGFALRSPIVLSLSQDGTFAAKLFDGKYKLTRRGNAPWLQQATDTITVNVNGNTAIDVPVTPYFNLTNDTYTKSGNTISARFVVDKIVPTANLDRVIVILSRSILMDHIPQAAGRGQVIVNVNTSTIVFGSQNSVTTDVPDELKNLDFVFARIGIKSTVSGEYNYTPVQKIALK
ncbi:DUF3823 domain-containing protein [Pedobacter alpinus]|uniref:DUF3823 domain-containing protein n=1 Tax=Pedobacter alpinus TaxID=1590643 RepID=A0ABW5TPR7_9SPHI